MKPVSDWDMAKPEPILALANHYEKHQISLISFQKQSEMLGCHSGGSRKSEEEGPRQQLVGGAHHCARSNNSTSTS